MATIVGDKLKLTNYSYLLTDDGKNWESSLLPSVNPLRRETAEKIIDAKDVDWRPYVILNYAYTGDKTPTNVTEPGDLWESGRLIDFISYSYSMSKNLRLNQILQPNTTPFNSTRPTLITNIGWTTDERDKRILSYNFWPAVGSVSQISAFDHSKYVNYYENPSSWGEVFNDYINNKATSYAHSEGNSTTASGIASHAEGLSTISYGAGSHAEGNSTEANGLYSHAEGSLTYVSGDYAHAEGLSTKSQGIASHAEGNLTTATADGSHSEGTNSQAIALNAHAEGQGTIANASNSHSEGLSSTSSGVASHAEGNNTVASGNSSHAEGELTKSSGLDSHAEGKMTESSGENSHAEGLSTKATKANSHSEGNSTEASGENSHAEGKSTVSSGNNSHSEGSSTKSSGSDSHAEGKSTVSSGNNSHAEGLLTEASGNASHTEGSSTKAIKENSHAEGNSTEASGENSHAEGNSSISLGINSHAEGESTKAEGNDSHSEGVSTTATKFAAHAEGNSTEASGESSHAEGKSTIASGNSSHAEGNTSKSLGENSHAEGGVISSYTIGTTKYNLSYTYYNISKGIGSHAEGLGNTSIGDGSHAEGGVNISNGLFSHTEGLSNKAIGDASHAEGLFTYAGGLISHSEGRSTKASGENSHAEGLSTTAFGENSHAEGNKTTSSGNNSHAEGNSTIASKVNAHAEGLSTTASGENSHAEGNKTTSSGNNSHAEGLSTKSEGIASHTEGNLTLANGNNAHAEGLSTTASGENSHTEGNKTNAGANNAHAEGSETKAIKVNTHAEGNKTIASGDNSHAEGNNSHAEGNNSHAEGNTNITSGENSHAEGSETRAESKNSHAEGNLTKTVGNNSHAEGYYTESSGQNSHAEGHSSKSSGTTSHAEGYYTESSGIYSHSEGSYTQSSANASHAEGLNSIANGNYSHAEGEHTTAKGEASHSEGYYTYAYNIGSHVEGRETQASGNYAHAEGYKTLSQGNYSHTEGQLNKSFGLASHTEGVSNNSYGAYSHTEGFISVSYGIASHAEGNSTYVFGNYAHAEGNSTEALGESSHAEGYNTTASKIGSHAEGNSTEASGQYSHAQGSDSIASGNVSFAAGDNSKATKQNSVAIGTYVNSTASNNEFGIGRFNQSHTGYMFTIGDGLDESHRHNAIEITSNGWTYISGLATYINRITNTVSHKPIAYTDNFIQIYSYNAIWRGIEYSRGTYDYQNSYNIDWVTYVIPTKNYIDKLLEAKDVLRFGGTFTIDSSYSFDKIYDSNGNIIHDEYSSTTVHATWNPVHNSNTYDEDDVNYYAYDYKAGAVWKVTNSGYFGNRYIQSGDLIISYSDSAKNTSSQYWAIVDTHINFVENNGHNRLNPSTSISGKKNLLLTNVHFSDSGQLSYTFVPLNVTYHLDSTHNNADRGNRKKGFISNIAIIPEHNLDGENSQQIEISYVYSGFETLNGADTSSKTYNYSWDLLTGGTKIGTTSGTNQFDGNSISLIQNVHLDEYGVLSYGRFDFTNIKSHHYTEDVKTGSTYNSRWTTAYVHGGGTKSPQNYNDENTYETGLDKVDVVTNVNLLNNGHLTYTYLSLFNLKSHHNTYNAKKWSYMSVHRLKHTYGNDDKYNRGDELSITYTQLDEITYIASVNLSHNGSLTYTYGTINRLRHHHDGSYTAVIHDNPVVLTRVKTKDLDCYRWSAITHVELSTDGKLSAKCETINLPDDVKNADQSDLAYALNSYVSWYHGYDKGAPVYIGAWHGNEMVTYDLNTHSTISGSEKIRHAYNIHTNTYNKTITNDDNLIGRFIDNVHLDRYGQLTYTYSSVTNLRLHHDTTTYATIDYDIDVRNAENEDKTKIITEVNLSAGGNLTYTAYNIKHLRNHHHTLSYIHTTTNVGRWAHTHERDIDVSGVKHTYALDEGDNSNRTIRFLSYAYLSRDGFLQTYYSNIINIRRHHYTIAYNTVHRYVIGNTNPAYSYTTINDKAENSYTTVTEGGDGFEFISYVKLDDFGYLTYTKSFIHGLRTHHRIKNALPWTYVSTHKANIFSNSTSYNIKEHTNSYVERDYAYFISYINLDKYGTLTYAYTYIDRLRNHHDFHNQGLKKTYDVDVYATTNKTDSIHFVTDVNFTASGYLTFGHSDVNHLRTHHHTYIEYHNDSSTYRKLTKELDKDIDTIGSANKNTDKDTIKYLTYAYINSEGVLYSYYAETKNLANHHNNTGAFKTAYDIKEFDVTSGATDSFGFISQVNLTTDGKFTYQYSSISNLKTHHGTTKPTTLTSYNIHTNVTEGVNTFGFMTAVNLDENGKLTYSIAYADNLRKHHDNADKGLAKAYNTHNSNTAGDNTLGFISNVNLSTNGYLTYQWSTVTNLRQHHDNSHQGNQRTYDVFTSYNAGDDTLGFISNVNLSTNGYLTYNTATITNLRKHHSDNFPSHSLGTRDFVTDVSLSVDGDLTGTFGKFSNEQANTPVGIRTSSTTHNHRAGAVVVMTYTYINSSGTLRNRYETITLSNQKVTTAKSGTTGANTLTVLKNVTISHSNTGDSDDNVITITYIYDNIWGTI